LFGSSATHRQYIGSTTAQERPQQKSKALRKSASEGLFRGGDGGTRTPGLHDVNVVLALSWSVLECPRVPSQRAFRHFCHSVRVRLCASFSGTMPRKCRAPSRSPEPPLRGNCKQLCRRVLGVLEAF